MTKATTKTNTKGGKASAKGKGKGKKEELISRWKIARVIIGMVLMFIAVFMILSFSSYLYSGAHDYSFCEGLQNGDILDESIKIKNAGGKLGLMMSFFFINEQFGLASYFIPIFLIFFSLHLIGSFKFKIFKMFVKMALMMVWLSIVLAVVSKLIPGIEDCHVKLGGGHGDRIHAMLNNAVGEVGTYGIILFSTLMVLIYLGISTVEQITEFFRFQKLKRMKDELSEKLKRKNENGDEEGEYVEIGQSGDPENFTNEEPTTYAFDNEGNLVEVKKDNGNESVSEGEGDNENGNEGDNEGKNDNENEDKEEGDKEKKGDADPDFTMVAAAQTEEGDGIEHDDESTPYDPKKELSHYKYPTLDLLDKREDSTPQIDANEQMANKNRIIHVLKSFGVEISSITATIGPTITLYEITPAEGMRISKIRNLEDDIALSLAAEGIRIIAPIPGKGTIGIEVPNKKKAIVSMYSILNSKTYQESKMELPCAMGKTITNEVFMVDLAKAPHMLVAGATGMGKSVGLNAIVTSLLYKKHPSELKIVMVDPKKVEFSIYAPIANQFLAKLEDEEDAIITDNQRVVKTLNALCKLMDDRYLLLKQAKVRNIKEYNEKFKARKLSPLEGHDYMPYYVVIVDEFGDLIMTAGKEIELPICRIAQLARAVGIHMIIATQRPTTNIITGTIKANFPARVAFKVSAMMDSRIILDRPGANQLIGRGDMLYLQSADPVRVQCAFVDTPEVDRICKFISEQQKFPCMTYLPEPPMEEGEGGGKDVDMNHLDPMFADVAKMVVSQNAGSTSLIQRKFSIGYNRAGRLMDQLESAGIVGPQMGSKPREVLITDLITLDSVLNALGAN
jgi:S-DNA-T family DNA segregation ATPase FtsK/SpoIIIE